MMSTIPAKELPMMFPEIFPMLMLPFIWIYLIGNEFLIRAGKNGVCANLLVGRLPTISSSCSRFSGLE